MSNKSIILKTFKKMKTINPEKGVSFAQQSLKGSAQLQMSQNIKARVMTSKELPTISKLRIEEKLDEEEEKTTDKKGTEANKATFQRRLHNKSSKTLKVYTGEALFNKISLANNSDYFYSNSNELFDSKEKVYIGLTYSANLAISISDFTYCENDNDPTEKAECKAIAIDNFEDNAEGLFCLFEGHGGSDVSNYLQKNYRQAFHKAKQLTTDIDNAIKISFYSIDKEMEEKSFTAGSSGNIVYIRRENNKRVIYAANVGHTKTYLITFDEAKELSYEHTVSNVKENKRLISNGGMFLNDKLMGHFTLSRSFGDYQLKAFGVKCEPYITRQVIEDKDMFIVIGNSSMWSLLSQSELLKLAAFNQSSSVFMKAITCLPSIDSFTDRIACFVLKLK